MSTTTENRTETEILDELTERYCASIGQPTSTEIDRGLDILLAHMASGDLRRRQVVRWSLLSAGLALCAVVLVYLGLGLRLRSALSEPPALTYQLEGGTVLEGGYLRESGDEGMRVQFNEGSTCAFSPGTRGQIHSVDKSRAHLGIERGSASFQINRISGRRWIVDAGPFVVTVTGTAFTVSWDPIAERFELRLRHGTVVVRGPVSAGEISLRSGQRLTVNLPKAESVIDEWEPQTVGAGAIAPPTMAPEPERTLMDEPPPASRPSSPSIPRRNIEPRWRDELAQGRWDRILSEAETMGIANVLDRVSSEDLFALADAARYRRRPDLARAALLAERRRFPHSPRALDVVFLLGRVEESQEHGEIGRAHV